MQKALDPLTALVLAHTAVAAPRLCRAIRLHLITPDQPLWRANQAQVDATGLEDPFWAFCWPGGHALAHHLLQHPEIVQGKRVLAFGAGGGVEAIAAAQCGADVLACDTDPVAVAALTLNATLNGVSIHTTTDDLLGTEQGPWDVVLAGDVTYERELARSMRAWLTQLARRGVLVLVADPRRGFLETDGWVEVACYDTPADDDTDGTRLVPTPVFSIPR
jgi:predicted nicotinamide N-methyase